jgi:glycosyltransferase involved in cell wall biosynthesis
MIVKNEEKNIRRALTWGKNIVCEQIVVDTGSTDRTVEIAEEMGAKVFHFEWIDDFSAAKNFAIEQATGNWIAFLDADEYFSDEDTQKIIPLITNLQKDGQYSMMPAIIRSSLVNLNDEGQPGSVATQDRMFSNNPALRYQNRIHETIQVSEGKKHVVFDATDRLTVYHTGYTKSVFKETRKMDRNIALLKREVKENPENYNAWAYLGDALLGNEQYEEAENAYNQVIENIQNVFSQERKDLIFSNLLKMKCLRHVVDETEILTVYNQSIDCKCTAPDIEYWVGSWMLDRGKEQKGIEYFELALKKLEQYQGHGVLDVATELPYIYQKIFEFYYRSMDHAAEAVRYGVLCLRIKPYGESVLMGLLQLLGNGAGDEKTAEAILGFLSKLYDFSKAKDKLFLIRVCYKLSYQALEQKVFALLSEEEKTFFNQNKQSIYQI